MNFFLNLVLTWSIGLVLPLLIRFVFLRRPLDKTNAFLIAFGNSAFLWIIFSVTSLIIGEREPSYGFAWVLVFFVAKAILSSQSSETNENKVISNEPASINGNAKTMQTNEKEDLVKSDRQINNISFKSGTVRKQKNKLAYVIVAIAVILIPIAFLYVYYYLPVASLSLDQNRVTLEVSGQETMLKAAIEPFFLSNRELVWTTTDPNIVTVSNTGLLTPNSDGVATVKVATIDGNKSATCTVTVIQPTIIWNGAEYKGELKSGIPDGFGEWIHPDGYTYVGSFKDGDLDGKGRMIYPDGREYEGEWSNNTMFGKGTLVFPNGDIYDGYFKDDLFHGHGTMKYVSGASYVGDWKNGKENGIGILTYQTGHVYNGGFKDGEFDGFGTITWPNGSIFRGEFENGNRHGSGEMTMPDGTSLIGVFVNDELTHGVWTFPDGTRSATGPEQWRIYE